MNSMQTFEVLRAHSSSENKNSSPSELITGRCSKHLHQAVWSRELWKWEFYAKNDFRRPGPRSTFLYGRLEAGRFQRRAGRKIVHCSADSQQSVRWRFFSQKEKQVAPQSWLKIAEGFPEKNWLACKDKCEDFETCEWSIGRQTKIRVEVTQEQERMSHGIAFSTDACRVRYARVWWHICRRTHRYNSENSNRVGRLTMDTLTH